MGQKLLKPKPFKESTYTKIVKALGDNSYRIVKPGEDFVTVAHIDTDLMRQKSHAYTCVSTSASTSTIKTQYFIEPEIELCHGTQVVDVRQFRYCEHDDTPHINADDNIICVDTKGNVWRIPRKDFPDHYISIAEWAGFSSLANAHNLPTKTEGTVSEYLENGALLPIKIECRTKK